MAKYKKKRARELKHDRFRDTTMSLFDRLGDRLEGKGQNILYGLGGAVLLPILIWGWVSRTQKKTQEFEGALGRAIKISSAPVTPSPSPGSTEPSFPTEQARAQSATEEFKKVADKYTGNPYHDEARYLMATNLV